MTSILFHVLPPIHREILVVAATLSRAKQGDGKSFSLVRREAKMYIYIYIYSQFSLLYILYIFFALISLSRLVAFFLLLGFYLRCILSRSIHVYLFPSLSRDSRATLQRREIRKRGNASSRRNDDIGNRWARRVTRKKKQFATR